MQERGFAEVEFASDFLLLSFRVERGRWLANCPCMASW